MSDFVEVIGSLLFFAGTLAAIVGAFMVLAHIHIMYMPVAILIDGIVMMMVGRALL